MRHRFLRGLLPCLALLPCILAFACRKPDEARPFATATVAPAQLRITPGTLHTLTYRFVVAPDAAPLADDYVVFVHALGEEDVILWTDDHQPPTPTSQWKPGATIEYTRETFVSGAIARGPGYLSLGLYSPKTNERVPLGGTSDGMRAYRVATLDIEGRADAPMVFLDGWNNAELTESGDAWRWTKGSSTVALRNPRKDAQLVVVADQPAALDWTQEVDVQVGGTMVDHFALPPGAREIRRISVPAAAMGDNELVRVMFNVGRTFVPKTVAALKSPDERELGIRLVGAYFRGAN